MKRFVYFFSFLILTSACKEVYEAPPQAFIQVSLLNSSTELAISPTVTVRGIGLDSIWIKPTSESSFLLPLSTKDTTRFQMKFDSVTDTLTIVHGTTQKYASMETGFYYEYKLRALQYTHHRINLLQISDSLVTINWHENIKFYLRPLSAGGN